MNYRRYRGLLAALSLVLAASTGQAQDQDQSAFVKAFSGPWYMFDRAFATEGQVCAIALKPEASPGSDRMQAEAANCIGPLSGLDGWGIAEGQLGLFAGDTLLALLGGNQRRITGEAESDGAGLILERQQGSAEGAALTEALARHRCFFLGFGKDCASQDDLRRPQPKPAEDGTSTAQVSVLVNLNVRDQPRANAPVIGTVPGGSCVTVNYCTIASDGIWCRARFGEQAGWMRKTALRQDEWPVVTYTDGCAASE